MKIITGDEFGLIKLISTQSKSVIDQYGSLDSSKSIINIFSNNKIEQIDNSEENEDEESETKDNLNLYISSINENYILNWDSKKVISSYKNENPDISYISSAIKFPYNSNNNTIFINGTSDSKVNLVSFDEQLKFNNSSIYTPLDTSNKNLKIKLRGIANSLYNTDSAYLLYQNNPFILYNINQQKIEFKGKNLPNDELNLRIPMHDMDIVEVKNNPRLNYISTAYGEIRLYDKKASPRPSLNKKITNTKINKIDITDDGNYLFVGDNSGYCAMLDIRKSFSACKTFKGNSGAIKTLVNIEQNNNLIVSGFDRYVRIYDYKSGGDEKIFVKNKVNSAILVELEKNKNKEFEDDDESNIKDSDLMDEEEGGEIEDSEYVENSSNGQNNKKRNNEQIENEDDEEENEEDNDDEEENGESNEDIEENDEENEDEEDKNEENEEENDEENEDEDDKNKENEEEEDENENENGEITEENKDEDESNNEENSSKQKKESSNSNSDKLEEDEEEDEDKDSKPSQDINEEEDEENEENDDVEEQEEVEKEEENEEENDENEEQEEVDNEDENEEEISLNEEEDEDELKESEEKEEKNDNTEEQEEELDEDVEEESEKKYNNKKRKREEKIIITNKNKKKKFY
jgi:hypothetical protein